MRKKIKLRTIVIILVVGVVIAGGGIWYYSKTSGEIQSETTMQMTEEEMEDFIKDQKEKGNDVEIRDDIEH